MSGLELKNKTNSFNVAKIREEFPILSIQVNNYPLVYFDNAATTQKPRLVTEALKNFYEFENANIHRGVHYLSERATELYENAREKVKNFINANSSSEIIFTRGTTESINLVATTMCRGGFLKNDDEVIISNMEHHSNIVPWQIICNGKGVKLKVVPVTDKGELDLAAYQNLFSERTKLVSIVHISNTLGTINPVKEIIKIAHNHGVPVLLDGAQVAAHVKIDVAELDCDYYAFSGHKMFAPTGVGILFGKESLLEKLPPYQGGGDMIKNVTFTKTVYDDLPAKFEAGTPNISGGIGMLKAVEFLSSLNRDAVEKYEYELLKYATEKLETIDGLEIIGQSVNKSAVISFVVKGAHPYDIGTLLDSRGIAIRTGHHCTQPIMERFNVSSTARASFALYNTFEEVDYFIDSLIKTINMLR